MDIDIEKKFIELYWIASMKCDCLENAEFCDAFADFKEDNFQLIQELIEKSKTLD